MRTDVSAGPGGELVIRIGNEAELFEGPEPVSVSRDWAPTPGWDDLGAALGEPGVTRLLRLAHADRGASRVLIRVDPGAAAVDPERLLARLRRWLEAREAANAAESRESRRAGLRALWACLALLAAALTVSFVAQNEAWFGGPGPLRTLLSEAVVIAGWVAMWRPLEMLLFDPMKPTLENRLLRRVLAMEWRVEQAAQGGGAAARGRGAG